MKLIVIYHLLWQYGDLLENLKELKNDLECEIMHWCHMYTFTER